MKGSLRSLFSIRTIWLLTPELSFSFFCFFLMLNELVAALKFKCPIAQLPVYLYASGCRKIAPVIVSTFLT